MKLSFIFFIIFSSYLFSFENNNQFSQTKHTIILNNEEINYTAQAGKISLKDEKGNITGNIFYIAYTKDDEDINRPITFAFNGGPGSSSIWLHIGAFGPKRIVSPEKIKSSTPPYNLIENPETLLSVTDLVFIDPIGTGFSDAEDENNFAEVNKDIESFASFILSYITIENRWLSPKYLLGESYGGLRAAALAPILQYSGIQLNGLMLIAPAIDLSLLELDNDNENNILPRLTYLPSFTSIACHHKKCAPEYYKNPQEAIEKAKNFAYNEYSIALLKGSLLSSSERNYIAERLSKFTGLSKNLILSNNLKIPLSLFMQQLLHEDKKIVGYFDGSKTLKIDSSYQFKLQTEASVIPFYGYIAATLNDFLIKDLQYLEPKLIYQIYSSKMSSNWDFSFFAGKHIDFSQSLSEALIINPDLKVFIATGSFDLAVPFFTCEYLVHHTESNYFHEKERIELKNYYGGHMMYLYPETLEKLSNDLKGFISN